MTTKKFSGFIIYRGPSLLDNKPIVVVAITGKSTNAKTGDMVQTYILADNGKSPVQSAKDLDDVSVCGDCKHRRGLGGSCYVNLGQGARAVMDGVMRGIYPKILFRDISKIARGRKVRLGTYGDPMAVPADVWLELVANASGHTGYSHQWNNPKFLNNDNLYFKQYLPIRGLCMASVDSEDEWVDASSENWRTFRVRAEGEDWLGKGEFVCPASAEAGKKKTCVTCMACDGVGQDGEGIKKATVVITVHGSLKSRFAASVSLV